MNNFDTMVKKLILAQEKLPTQIATLAVNFSKERFRKQNWVDTAAEPWKPRKNRRRGGKNRSQTLLVDTEILKKSIRKISATRNLIVVGTDVPYASIHNEGGTIQTTAKVKEHPRRAHERTRNGRKETVKAHTVQAHGRKMNTTIRARPFIGNSAVLMKKMEDHIVKTFENAMRNP